MKTLQDFNIVPLSGTEVTYRDNPPMLQTEGGVTQL